MNLSLSLYLFVRSSFVLPHACHAHFLFLDGLAGSSLGPAPFPLAAAAPLAVPLCTFLVPSHANTRSPSALAAGVVAPPVGASLPAPYLPSMGAPTAFPTYPLPGAALGGIPTGMSCGAFPSFSHSGSLAVAGIPQGFPLPTWAWQASLPVSHLRDLLASQRLIYVNGSMYILATVPFGMAPLVDRDLAESDDPIDVDAFEFAMGG